MLPLPNGASVCLISFSKNQKRWLLESNADGYGIVKVRMRGEFFKSLREFLRENGKMKVRHVVVVVVGRGCVLEFRAVFAFWVFRELTKGFRVCDLFLT